MINIILMPYTKMEDLTVKQLRKIAIQCKIKNCSKLRKDKIIKELHKHKKVSGGALGDDKPLPNPNTLPHDVFPAHMMWGDESQPIIVTSTRPFQGVYSYGSPRQAEAQREFNRQEQYHRARQQVLRDVGAHHIIGQRALQEREDQRRAIAHAVEAHPHTQAIRQAEAVVNRDQTRQDFATILAEIPPNIKQRYIAYMEQMGNDEADAITSLRTEIRDRYYNFVRGGLPNQQAVNNTVRDLIQYIQTL